MPKTSSDCLSGEPHGALMVRSYQHGDVAVLRSMIDRLDVVATIDRHVPRSCRSMSVGTTLALAAINRAVRPRSKAGWADWAVETSVPILFDIDHPEKVTSQHFWDQMNLVSEEALKAIEGELTRRIVEEFRLPLDTLLYDATNYFTYIASDNDRPKLPQRGHSKQKRSDLRIFSVAVLATRDGQIPLLAQVYEGNKVDSKQFPDSLTEIQTRLQSLLGKEISDVTLVFDKGNNSRDNFARVDAGPIHYVASLPLNQHKDLAAIAMDKYVPLPKSSALAGLPVHRCQKTIWGKERTVVLVISPTLREGQSRGLDQHLKKRLRALDKWKLVLQKPGSGPRTAAAGRTRAQALCSGQYVKDVLRVEYDHRKKGAHRLSWFIDAAERARLEADVFGKMILITDRHAWSTEDIVKAYRGQSHVERVFRQTKDPEHLAVRPQYHWTDQKIRVHAFICFLAYTLSRLIQREAEQQAKWKGSLSTLLKDLGKIRLAMVAHIHKDGGKPQCQWVLEQRDPSLLKLYRGLVPDRPPFVYTPSAP
ncbi:MAG: IS1634 family transposase [Armatimonadetes bacterium]|nr:IS1634 family transposase [Armatimonadota bacterium]